MEKKSKLIDCHTRDSESCTVVGTTRRAYSNSREPLNMCRREEETQPGLFFSSTPVLRPKKAILRRIHTVAALGLVGMWERLHVIDGHSWLFFSFSLFSSLSSVFACLRELSLPAGCLFHGFLFILHCFSFILNSTRDRPSIGPRPFSTSAIYDFILGQVDRRRYNTTTALLSLDCYTTAIISMSTSTLEPLRGSCSCGRNRYLIRILDDDVTDHAQIHFDSSSDNRASDYTLPLWYAGQLT